MYSTSSLLLLSDPLWPKVVAPFRIFSMGQIELFNHLTVCKQMTDNELLVLHSNTWNYFIVRKLNY